MNKNKFYFKNVYSEVCYEFDYHLNEAIDNNLTEINLVEAIPIKISGICWCSENEATVDLCSCNKTYCESYAPKINKTNGICCYRGRLFEKGKNINFKIK